METENTHEELASAPSPDGDPSLLSILSAMQQGMTETNKRLREIRSETNVTGQLQREPTNKLQKKQLKILKRIV